MLEFIILIVFSFIIRRYLKDKYVIASAANMILFLFLSITYFFSSDFTLFVYLGKKMLGVETYEFLHGGLIDTVDAVNIGVSALAVVEIVIFSLMSIAAILTLIKGFKQLLKKLKVKNFLKKINLQRIIIHLEEPITLVKDGQKTYLLFCDLEN